MMKFSGWLCKCNYDSCTTIKLFFRIDITHNKKAVEAIHAELGGDFTSIRGK